MWRRLFAVLLAVMAVGTPTVGAANQSANTTTAVTDTAYQDVVAIAATPGDYEQATILFKAVGAEIAFALGGLLVLLLIIAGVAGYWREDRFWAMYFLTLLGAAAALIVLPYLWVLF